MLSNPRSRPEGLFGTAWVFGSGDELHVGCRDERGIGAAKVTRPLGRVAPAKSVAVAGLVPLPATAQAADEVAVVTRLAGGGAPSEA